MKMGFESRIKFAYLQDDGAWEPEQIREVFEVIEEYSLQMVQFGNPATKKPGHSGRAFYKGSSFIDREVFLVRLCLPEAMQVTMRPHGERSSIGAEKRFRSITGR